MKKKVRYLLAKYILLAYVLTGIFAPFIAGESPLYCNEGGTRTFPVLDMYLPSEKLNRIPPVEFTDKYCVMPLIAYSPGSMDQTAGKNTGPIEYDNKRSWKHIHWLGTDRLGRDIASGIIYGTATAIKIAGISVFISFLLGAFIGILSAYYGNKNWRLNLIQILFGILAFTLGSYYLVYELLIFSKEVFWFICLFSLLIYFIFILNHYLLNRINVKKIAIPIDLIVMKVIEIRKSIPGLFLILAMVTIFAKPSLWNIILILSLLGWTEFARYARAETMSIKEENYILSAKIFGFNDLRIMFHHILPNILPTLMVVVCFNAGNAILMESSLSFLGIGLPVEEVSWGKIMAEGRDMQSWWLVVFPGSAIFVFLLCLNTIATQLQIDNRIG
ncbi:MAG: ABC transporter permease [Saprospiraceae bacterium]|nr:ABC transporter permease [Saprospiraceae bacterium]